MGDRAGWRLRTYPLVVLAALGLAVVVAVLTADGDAALTGTIGGDLPEFVGAGRIVAAGDGLELYDPARQIAAQVGLWPTGEGGAILFAYPAAVAGPYALVDGLDYRLVYLLHTAAMVLAVGAAARLLVERLPVLAGRRWIPLGLAFTLTFLPMFIGVFNGQTTALVLVLLVAAWVALCDDREVLAGVATGLLVLKPQYGLVVIGLLVLGRRWRAVAAATAAATVLWLVGALLAGPGWTARWWELVRGLSHVDGGVNLGNEVSPLGLAELVWGQGSSVAAVVGLGASIVVGVVLVVSLRGVAIDDPIVPALVMPSLLLIAPHSLYYDAGLLVVALAALLPHVTPSRRPAVVAAWWALGLTHLAAAGLGVEPVALVVVGTWAWALDRRWRTGPSLAA